MTETEAMYHELANQIPGTVKGKMFGALCLKCTNNNKAYLMYWNDLLIFKLTGDSLKKALELKGAKLFDPMGGKPMRGWVQLDHKHINKWEDLANEAYAYVKDIK